MIWSLEMAVEKAEGGGFRVDAPWLEEPVKAPTWEEAYRAAFLKKPKKK